MVITASSINIVKKKQTQNIIFNSCLHWNENSALIILTHDKILLFPHNCFDFHFKYIRQMGENWGRVGLFEIGEC